MLLPCLKAFILKGAAEKDAFIYKCRDLFNILRVSL